jgi:transposase
MYDVTSLHFEVDEQDDLKRLGKNKDGRKDPQVQVGLLVDSCGFPLEVAVFPGNQAETTTIVPVLDGFKQRHGWIDVIVVADAGMLSAGNLNALEQAGYLFIVGSRISKAPYDLAGHFEAHGDYLVDGQIVETTRMMGENRRRVVYQYSFKRQKRDIKVINEQVERAEKLADGKQSQKSTRFVKTTPGKPEVDWARIEKARRLAGLKGYVTNIPVPRLSGTEVICAYHDLANVETSFRMAKSDLGARPFHTGNQQQIEAHTTIVFAALAISRHLQQLTGISIKQLVKHLRRLRSATIEINGQTITIPPKISPKDQQLLQTLNPKTGD